MNKLATERTALYCIVCVRVRLWCWCCVVCTPFILLNHCGARNIPCR